jgi:hemoglobin-like flavoprotein
VASANPEFISRFYNTLFERYPQCQRLFPVGNRAGQAEMLATLAEVAGPSWTPELDAAWAEAYSAIVSIMLARASS